MKIKRKGIYLADLGKNEKTSVESGVRPVLVLQNNKGNKYSPTVIIAPITSKLKKWWIPTHVILNNPSLPQKSLIMLEQIQTIEKKKLIEYKGCVSYEEMEKIERASKISLGLTGGQYGRTEYKAG